MAGDEQHLAVGMQVHGVVQGVGFRYHARREAERLGVSGWVRNDPDGTVVGHLEGPSSSVRALVAWCRGGPEHAQVDRVDTREAEVSGATGFDVA